MAGRGAKPAPSALGRFLSRARARKEFTIRELARRSDVSATIISRIESGQTGTLEFETLCRLAAQLDFSLDELAAAAGLIEQKPEAVARGAIARLRQAAFTVSEQLKKAQERLDAALDE